MKILEVKNLKVHFKDKHNNIIKAVDNISLFINQAECVGLFGESANGKSSTILGIFNLLSPNLLYYKEADSIIFREKIDIKNSKNLSKVLNHHIGIVFQDSLNSLHPLMCVGNILSTIIKNKFHLTKKTAQKHALNILTTMGFSNPIEIYHKYPCELSGGMRQKIILATHIATKPQLIIADEPFSFLDIQSIHDLMKLINMIKYKNGTGFLITSHDMSILYNICDRIYVISKGKIIDHQDPYNLCFRSNHKYVQKIIKSFYKFKMIEEIS